MRWQPDSPVCAECGFDWQLARQDAIDLVAQVPDAAAVAITGMHYPERRPGEAWSPSMYVWHLVDVLRIGTERLLTLAHDPGRGITCWDENAPRRGPPLPAALACCRGDGAAASGTRMGRGCRCGTG